MVALVACMRKLLILLNSMRKSVHKLGSVFEKYQTRIDARFGLTFNPVTLWFN